MSEMPKFIVVDDDVPEPVRWTRTDDDLLREAYAAGQTDEQIAACFIHHNAKDVGNRRRRLNLGDAHRKDGERPWTSGDFTSVEELFWKGFTDDQIAHELSRTRGAVKSIRSKLFLSRVTYVPLRDRMPDWILNQAPAEPRNPVTVEMMRASILHLVDLKRAGHSPRDSEYVNTNNSRWK